MNLESHLRDVYPGEVAADEISTYCSLQIAAEEINEFNQEICGSFHKNVSDKVITEYNTENVLTLVLYLLQKDIKLINIFHYVLSPLPISLLKSIEKANYPYSINW